MLGKRFQIHENGKPVDGGSYCGSFEALCREWSHAPTGREVVEIDGSGNVLRHFTSEECRESIQKLMSEGTSHSET